MDIFSRINPAYKNVSKLTAAQAQPAASSWLSGLLGPLFGSSMPAYKTIDGQSAQAPSSLSGFWPMLGSAPSYKTVSAASAAPVDVDACDACDLGIDENAACDLGPDQIVVL